jgi:hypothetical protein
MENSYKITYRIASLVKAGDGVYYEKEFCSGFHDFKTLDEMKESINYSFKKFAPGYTKYVVVKENGKVVFRYVNNDDFHFVGKNNVPLLKKK